MASERILHDLEMPRGRVVSGAAEYPDALYHRPHGGPVMSRKITTMPWSEYVAMRFHQAYEELAPSFGYETRPESAVPWADVPEQNRHLMEAVVRRLLAEGIIRG